MDASSERNNDFTDHVYQQNLDYFEQSHTSKIIKNNLKISELLTDPSHAYQTQRVCFSFIRRFRFLFVYLECTSCESIKT
jgi:hypothetical protein